MIHIPFQHSYAKGGTGCYLEMESSAQPGDQATSAVGVNPSVTDAAGATSSEASSTLSYMEPSAAVSTDSFPSDTSCSDDTVSVESVESSSDDVDFLSGNEDQKVRSYVGRQ